MIRVNKDIAISFVYQRPKDSSKPLGVTCFLVKIDDKGNTISNLSEGSSKCHVKDNFEKNKGRCISLSRAVQSFTADKEARKEVWDAYHSRNVNG